MESMFSYCRYFSNGTKCIFYGTIFLVSSATDAVQANFPSPTEKELDSAIGKSLQDGRQKHHVLCEKADVSGGRRCGDKKERDFNE